LIHADIYNLTTRILPSPSPSRSGYSPLYWKQKELAEIRWCHNNRIFQFSKDKIFGFKDFCIFNFGYVFGMKKATGDPMVSRRLHFWAHFRFSKKE